MEAALFGTVVLCPYVALFACSVTDHGGTPFHVGVPVLCRSLPIRSMKRADVCKGCTSCRGNTASRGSGSDCHRF